MYPGHCNLYPGPSTLYPGHCIRHLIVNLEKKSSVTESQAVWHSLAESDSVWQSLTPLLPGPDQVQSLPHQPQLGPVAAPGHLDTALHTSVLSLYLDERKGVQGNTSMRSREFLRAQPEGTPETECHSKEKNDILITFLSLFMDKPYE